MSERDTPREAIERFFPGGFSLRDEANAITAFAVRNGPIEDLHAGEDSELLSNPKLSRLTQEDINIVMIHASKSIEKLLRMKETDPEKYAFFIVDYSLRYCRGWER